MYPDTFTPHAKPIYLGAMSPGMLRLAGELADGALPWSSKIGRLLSTPVVNSGDKLWGSPVPGVDTLGVVGAQPVGDDSSAPASAGGDLQKRGRRAVDEKNVEAGR